MIKIVFVIACQLAINMVYAADLVDLGIDTSRSLSSISHEEAHAACVASQSAKLTFSDTAQCTLMGLGQATQQACEQARDACIANGPAPIPDPVVRCDDGESTAFTQCGATVGLVQDCLNDRLNLTRELFEGLSCANVGTFPNPPTPNACVELNKTCPGLFE